MCHEAAVTGHKWFKMAALNVVLAVLALGTHAHSSVVLRANEATLTLEPQLTGGFDLVLLEGDVSTTLGVIGRTLVSTFTYEMTDDTVAVQVNGANLTISTVYNQTAEARGIKIKWNTENPTRFEDCFDFGEHHWYGGPMQVNQIYPIENADLEYAPYITKELDNGAIVERYWLNSAGAYIYVHPQVPLFVDYKNIMANHICFGAQIADPYSSKRNHTELSYDIWLLSNVKAAHKHAVENYLGKPSGVPDFRMVQHPIWSTWAEYSQGIDEEKVLEYANLIRQYGFNDSQIEIDDLWEVCYGSLTVDETKFPDLAGLVTELKALGFRVTIWVHPFINKDCDPWYTEALENGYLVLNEEGSPDTSWWNNNSSIPGYVDFTNPAAADWWTRRLNNLSELYGIDSFKFDAGESSFTPQIAVQTGDIDLHPHHIVQSYVKTCAKFGGMIEVRTAFRTQELPVFIRMVDRDSIWGINNGLQTVVTTTLQMNLAGYPFVLPDMIGGNGFNLNHDQAALPDKQLFIRWVQANTFLPAMQYSFAPWKFDEETVSISKMYTELHAEYADVIYAAMEAAASDGTPVNAPLWWRDPTDSETWLIWDEYLLAETILVAPILVENATTRDIYLPAGTWLEQGDSEKVLEGNTWLRDYPAPLDVLPYFVLQTSSTDAAGAPQIAVALILLGIIANLFNFF